MKHSIRYTVEHQLLPRELYESGPMLLLRIMGNPGDIMSELYAKASEGCPGLNPSFDGRLFTETHQEFHRKRDSILVIRVSMPEPEKVMDCRAVYLCYSRTGSHNMLFSSELGADHKYHLCGWDWNNRHINFGAAPDEAQDEADNVASYYWEMMRNGGSDIIQAIDEPAEPAKSLRSS